MKTTILIGINQLPSEYKGDKDGIKEYEKDYNVKLIPYDSSKENMQGGYRSVPQITKVGE